MSNTDWYMSERSEPKSGGKERYAAELRNWGSHPPGIETFGGSQTSDSGIRTRMIREPQLHFPELFTPNRSIQEGSTVHFRTHPINSTAVSRFSGTNR
jgi:hypothetical protein